MTKQTLRQLIWVLFSSLLFVACQSINQSGHDYMQDKRAWRSMADVSTNFYKQHNVTLSAMPTWQETGYGRHYQLVDFSFSKPLDEYRINLFSPKFSNKYICNWYCELLNEMVKKKPDGHFTYLSKLYADNKSELLSFYEQLLVLEEHILTLELPEQTLKLRLMKLQLSTKKLDTLPQVIAHLTQYIDSEQSALAAVQQAEPAITNTNEQDNNTEASSTPSTAHDLSSSKQQQPLSAQAITLLADKQLVCSNLENYFGHVLEQNQEQVVITLLGQAKQLIGGENMNLPPKTLYSKEGAFRYIELSGIKIFDRADIMPCKIDFPTASPLAKEKN